VATSGITTYNPNAINIVNRAARLIRVIQEGETLSANIAQDFFLALNSMVKEWQATGLHVWSTQEACLFLQPNQARYGIGGPTPDHCCDANDFVQTTANGGASAGATTLVVADATGMASGDKIGVQLADTYGSIQWTTISGAPAGETVTLGAALTSSVNDGALVFAYTTDLVRPLKVPDCRRRAWNTGGPANWIDTPAQALSHVDYQQLPNKLTTGIPTQSFFQPTLVTAYMNVWPVPVDGTNAWMFTYLRPLEIFSTNATTSDFPEEWVAALSYGLAVEMVPEFDVPAARAAVLAQIKNEKVTALQLWDREPEPIYFGVDFDPSSA
jgi:hypothetical protein